MPDWKAIARSQPGAEALPLDVLEEVAQHAEELYGVHRATGASESESMRVVIGELSQMTPLARAARQMRQRSFQTPEPAPGKGGLPSSVLRDCTHGLRVLLARPAFTAIAVATLALGIGANTAIFSVVYSLLLAPLPFPQSERLVMLWETALSDRNDVTIVSAPNWKDWRDNSASFERIAIWEDLIYNISGGSEPEQVAGSRVSASLFPMLGVAPALGRTFSDAEDTSGSHVVVLSDSLWRRRFNADPLVLGKSLRVNGEPHEVIGVMPPGFNFVTHRFQLWVPIQFNATDEGRDSHSFLAAGRLKPGLSFDNARNEFEAVARRIEAQTHEGHGATMTPLADFGVRGMGQTLTALVAAVGFVLLIACVNVANLLLAQSAARHKEFLVRAALGASRWRLAQQLLAEGMLLAVGGAIVGVLVAWAGSAALAQSVPPSVTSAPFRSGTISLNTPALLYTVAIAALTGLLFSFTPLLGLGRLNAGSALKAAGDRGGTSRSTLVRTALVGAEIALAVVVLVAAGLMVKSVARLSRVDPGLDPTNVLLLSVALPQPDFYGPPVRTTFCDGVQREVESLPGVRTVGAISQLPLEGSGAGRGFSIEGRPEPTENDAPGARYRLVCPGYFASLGIPVLSGRDFTAGDTTTSMPVAIISESTAKLYWPNEDPIGARIQISGDTWITIVGVVADVKQIRLDAVKPRLLYRSYNQAAWPSMTVTVKTATEPMASAPAVERALRRLDTEMPVSMVRSMESVLTDSMSNRRFPMQLLGLFAIVALLLAAIGVYGVVSYLVTQRTREMGIRVALGARRGEVVRLVVVRALTPIGIGLGVGLAAAVATSRALGTLLYEVRPVDPVVFTAIAVLLGGCAIAASVIPARRAAAVDPIVVLRQE